jgi:hypothetical protein
MIKRTCSNPECQKELPLNETYFRKRANGVFRTDCRKCEAKGRAKRRNVEKYVPHIKVPAGFKTTDEVREEMLQDKHKEHLKTCHCRKPVVEPTHHKDVVMANLTIDLSDPMSLINAIGSILNTIKEITGGIDKEKENVTHLTGNLMKDYLIRNGKVLCRGREEGSGYPCQGCYFCDKTSHCTVVNDDDVHCDDALQWIETDIPVGVLERMRGIVANMKK